MQAVAKALEKQAEESFDELKSKSEKTQLDDDVKAEIRALDISHLPQASLSKVFGDVLKEIPPSDPEESQIRQLKNKGEYIERLLTLRHAIDKERLEIQVHWFANQGNEQDLDWLREIKVNCENPLLDVVIRAQEQIVKRELPSFLSYFELSAEEFIQSIETTIANCQRVEHPELKRVFDASSAGDVLSAYAEIMALLKLRNTLYETRAWFNTPIKNFRDETVKTALVSGKVLQVLYYLRKVEEQVFA